LNAGLAVLLEDAIGPFAVDDETNAPAEDDSDETAWATLNGDGWLIVVVIECQRQPTS
jgi:hypothetical protein